MKRIERLRRAPLWVKIAAALVVIWALGAASYGIGQLGGSAPPDRGNGVTTQTP